MGIMPGWCDSWCSGEGVVEVQTTPHAHHCKRFLLSVLRNGTGQRTINVIALLHNNLHNLHSLHKSPNDDTAHDTSSSKALTCTNDRLCEGGGGVPVVRLGRLAGVEGSAACSAAVGDNTAPVLLLLWVVLLASCNRPRRRRCACDLLLLLLLLLLERVEAPAADVTVLDVDSDHAAAPGSRTRVRHGQRRPQTRGDLHLLYGLGRTGNTVPGLPLLLFGIKRSQCAIF